MNKLEQVAQNELRPIAILTAANNIRAALGKTGIEYDETIIEGNNRITIEGKANTINELNAYTTALRKSGTFELVEDPKSLKRAGQTQVTFTVTLDYTHREPEPVAAESAPPVAMPQLAAPSETVASDEATADQGGEE
jgi:Tfp pilus assembly protein PilN